jgi:uncharacterized membrane protein
MQYFILKTIHIASVVLFLGNIITGVFWKAHGDASRDLRARAQVLDGIIKSDRYFTLPGVALIIVSGVLLAITMHLPILGTTWILWALILFGISGVAFSAFVGPLQKRMLKNVQSGLGGNWNQSEYETLSRAWMVWGLVATAAPVGALVLMVMKPS